MLHGVFLALERAGLGKLLSKLPPVFQHGYTLVVVVIAWVFFRADNLSYAFDYIKALGGFSQAINYSPLIHVDYYLLLVFFAALIFSTNIRSHFEVWMLSKLSRVNAVLLNTYSFGLYFSYIALFVYSAVELAQNNYNPFIYFRF